MPVIVELTLVDIVRLINPQMRKNSFSIWMNVPGAPRCGSISDDSRSIYDFFGDTTVVIGKLSVDDGQVLINVYGTEYFNRLHGIAGKLSELRPGMTVIVRQQYMSAIERYSGMD